MTKRPTPSEFVVTARNLIREAYNIPCCAITTQRRSIYDHDYIITLEAPLTKVHTLHLQLGPDPKAMLAYVRAPGQFPEIHGEQVSVARRALRLGTNNLIGWMGYADAQLAEHVVTTEYVPPANPAEWLRPYTNNTTATSIDPTSQSYKPGVWTPIGQTKSVYPVVGKVLMVYADLQTPSGRDWSDGGVRWAWGYITDGETKITNGTISAKTPKLIDGSYGYETEEKAKEAVLAYAAQEGWEQIPAQPAVLGIGSTPSNYGTPAPWMTAPTAPSTQRSYKPGIWTPVSQDPSLPMMRYVSVYPLVGGTLKVYFNPVRTPGSEWEVAILKDGETRHEHTDYKLDSEPKAREAAYWYALNAGWKMQAPTMTMTPMPKSTSYKPGVWTSVQEHAKADHESIYPLVGRILKVVGLKSKTYADITAGILWGFGILKDGETKYEIPDRQYDSEHKAKEGALAYALAMGYPQTLGTPPQGSPSSPPWPWTTLGPDMHIYSLVGRVLKVFPKPGQTPSGRTVDGTIWSFGVLSEGGTKDEVIDTGFFRKDEAQKAALNHARKEGWKQLPAPPAPVTPTTPTQRPLTSIVASALRPHEPPHITAWITEWSETPEGDYQVIHQARLSDRRYYEVFDGGKGEFSNPQFTALTLREANGAQHGGSEYLDSEEDALQRIRVHLANARATGAWPP